MDQQLIIHYRDYFYLDKIKSIEAQQVKDNAEIQPESVQMDDNIPVKTVQKFSKATVSTNIPFRSNSRKLIYSIGSSPTHIFKDNIINIESNFNNLNKEQELVIFSPRNKPKVDPKDIRYLNKIQVKINNQFLGDKVLMTHSMNLIENVFII